VNMLNSWPAAAILALCCLAAPLPAHAGSAAEIGRVKLVLAEDGWQAVGVKAASIGVATPGATVAVEGSIAGQAKLLTLRSAEGVVQAVVLVYTTYGTGQSIIYSNNCPATMNGLYVHDLAKGRRQSPECIFLGGPFGTEAQIDAGGLSRMRAARKETKFDLPPAAYLVNAFFANSSGAVIQVEALLSPEFKGAQGSPLGGPLPKGLPPEIAAWGDALGLAVREALNSFSGELRMPPIAFR
jgi:hypothetical protein